jgi:hypothetical protein
VPASIDQYSLPAANSDDKAALGEYDGDLPRFRERWRAEACNSSKQGNESKSKFPHALSFSSDVRKRMAKNARQFSGVAYRPTDASPVANLAGRAVLLMAQVVSNLDQDDKAYLASLDQ